MTWADVPLMYLSGDPPVSTSDPLRPLPYRETSLIHADITVGQMGPAPRVTAWMPENAAADAPLDTDIRVTFDRDMDVQFLREGGISLWAGPVVYINGSPTWSKDVPQKPKWMPPLWQPYPVPIQVFYNAATRTAVVEPQEALWATPTGRAFNHMVGRQGPRQIRPLVHGYARPRRPHPVRCVAAHARSPFHGLTRSPRPIDGNSGRQKRPGLMRPGLFCLAGESRIRRLPLDNLSLAKYIGEHSGGSSSKDTYIRRTAVSPERGAVRRRGSPHSVTAAQGWGGDVERRIVVLRSTINHHIAAIHFPEDHAQGWI